MGSTGPRLIVVLGDQLSTQVAALRQGVAARDVVLMAEVQAEARYAPHRPKMIAFVPSAMRHFAQQLEQAGWRVRYVKLVDPENSGKLVGEFARARAALGMQMAVATEPSEYRLQQAFARYPNLDTLSDDRFIASPDEFRQWAYEHARSVIVQWVKLSRPQ